MSLQCVKKRMDALLDLGVPGCSISIRQDHKEIYRYICGVRDRETRVPMNGEEYFYIFSCTKPITVAAAMQLMEKGVLSLDTPVADFLPEFGDVMVDENNKLVPPREPITVHHLMTMSAGLNYNIGNDFTGDRETVTTRQMAAQMCRNPLLFHPGDRYKYSICLDVLAAVMEVATGERYSEYLRKNIFEPLGMKHTSFDRHATPMASQYKCISADGYLEFIGDEQPYNFNDLYESGGGGLVSTLDDYALFADAMACGGVGATGNRILTETSIDALRVNQIGTFVRDPQFSCAAGPGYGYGLGVRTLIDKSQGQRSPLGEFGWDGADGAFLIVDPDNHLSFSFMQHIRSWPLMMREFYAPIRDEVYDALGL